MAFWKLVCLELHHTNMVMSSVVFAIICGCAFKPASLAAIDYGPIKIIVRESPDALTDIVHQGENFYFKHHVNLPPSHFEAMVSLIQEDASRLEEETEKLQDILKPFVRPGSNLSKHRVSKVEPLPKPSPLPVSIILDNEEPKLIISEQQQNPKDSALPQLFVNSIPAKIEDTILEEPNIYKENPVKIPEIILKKANVESNAHEGNKVVPQISALQPITTMKQVKEEPKINKESILVDSIAQMLPTLSSYDYPGAIKVVKEEQPNEFSGKIMVVPEAPILKPFSVNSKPVLVEEGKLDAPQTSQKDESTLHLSSVIIPEAPILPPLSINEYNTAIESAKLNKPHVHEDNREVIPEAPILSVPEYNTPPFVSEMKIEESKINKENKVIPEAPIFSRTLVKNNPAFIEEDKLEKPISFEKSRNVIHSSPGIISETPMITDDIDVKVEEQKVSMKSDDTVYLSSLIIPEAPTLPTLSANNYATSVKEVNSLSAIKESNKSKDTLRHLSENSKVENIPESLGLPSLSLKDLLLHEQKDKLDNFGGNVLESYISSKIGKDNWAVLKSPELLNEYVSKRNDKLSNVPEISTSEAYISQKYEEVPDIPDAPTLPPLPSNDIFVAAVEKEKLNEESSVLPKVSGFPKLESIPEAPVLPPLSLDDLH